MVKGRMKGTSLAGRLTGQAWMRHSEPAWSCGLAVKNTHKVQIRVNNYIFFNLFKLKYHFGVEFVAMKFQFIIQFELFNFQQKHFNI